MVWKLAHDEWYGMVWYGLVWYGMVWYGMVWKLAYDEWYGMEFNGMVWKLAHDGWIRPSLHNMNGMDTIIASNMSMPKAPLSKSRIYI